MRFTDQYKIHYEWYSFLSKLKLTVAWEKIRKIEEEEKMKLLFDNYFSALQLLEDIVFKKVKIDMNNGDCVMEVKSLGKEFEIHKNLVVMVGIVDADRILNFDKFVVEREVAQLVKEIMKLFLDNCYQKIKNVTK